MTNTDALTDNLHTLIGIFDKICEMHKNNETDKEKYMDAVKNAHIQIPINTVQHYELTASLQREMDVMKSLIYEYPDSPVTKAMTGMQYINHALWNKIKDMGIGRLSDFYAKNRVMSASINLCIRTDKKDDETKAEYKERKSLLFANCPFSHEKEKHTAVHRIVNTPENTKLLLEMLNWIFDITHYKLTVRDGLMHDIQIYASDIKDIIPVENNARSSVLADIEAIAKMANEGISTISTILQFPEIRYAAELNVISTYYGMCRRLCIKNDFTEEYERKNMMKTQENKDIQAMIMDMGKSVSVKNILDASHKINDFINNRMQDKYSITIGDSMIAPHAVKFRMVFSEICKYDLGDDHEFAFDFIREDEDENIYRISASHADDLKQALLQNDNIEISNMDIRFDKKFYISDMDGYISDAIRLAGDMKTHVKTQLHNLKINLENATI